MKIVGPNDPQANTPATPQVDLKEQPDVTCPNCGGVYFQMATRFKLVSKLLTASPEDQVAPLQTYRCVDCGGIPEIFNVDAKL